MFLCILILVCGLTAVFRAATLQIFPDPRLKKLAAKQYRKVIHLNPRRGTIYDRNERVLAISIEKYSVYCMKQNLGNRWDTAQHLSKILGKSRSQLLKRINAKGSFRWLARKVDKKTALKVQKLNLPGIGVVPESKRAYPQNATASHILGFVGSEGQGLEGVEHQYDKLLKGETIKMVTLRDNYRRPIFLKNDAAKQARDGYKLHLTLDSRLQFLSEKYLEETIKEHNADQGTVVMMDPHSGAILAMATYPYYNPNFPARSRLAHRRNRSITDVFEPGSTFKAVTVAWALDQKAIGTYEKFDPEKGRFKVGRATINEAHEKPLKFDVTPKDILMRSNNVGSAKIALKMGANMFYDGVRTFGFGRKLGVDLPGESAGILKPKKIWHGIDMATIGFGQGISTTPLQMTASYSVFANGGYLPEPYVVDRVEGPEGGLVYNRGLNPKRKRVVSKVTTDKISSWLETVFGPSGTAHNLKIPKGYRFAGKTGTAQIPDPVEGGYKKDSYVSSFIGYGPLPKPQFVLLVAIHNPSPAYYGNVVAGPLWKKIALKALQPTWDVDGPAEGDQIATKLPQITKLAKRQLAKQKEKQELALPPPNRTQSSVMPNLKGLTMRQALNRLRGFRQNTEVVGVGTVIGQSPKPDQKLNSNSKITLKLKSD